MYFKKGQLKILIINLVLLLLFGAIFLNRQNYEFILYVGVIFLFLILIITTNKKVLYPNYILWGLTLWSFMHMSGGGIYIQGKKIYEIILFPIMGDPYYIFKYDQLVHIIGFGVATLLMYHLINLSTKNQNKKLISLSIVLVMAGLGAGALNEILEFIATVFVPETGVGGYINTSLDLVADLIGSLIALIYIIYKEKKGG
ncbi:DUF2238 domain-containing protein [bacterium]|nr:DUF2238 domain-containing protein [bacterium]